MKDAERPFRAPTREAGRALLETTLLGLVLAAVGLGAYPEDPGILAPRLDPYLVLAMVQALRYPRLGSLLAVLAALGLRAAAVVAGAGSWAATPYAVRDALLESTLAIAFVAVVAGELGARVERALRRSRHRRGKLGREVADLKRRATMLALAREELEERLEAQPVTLATFYRAARRMQSPDPARIEEALLELASELTEATRCELWEVDGDEVVLRRGAGAGAEPPGTRRPPGGLERRALGTGQVELLADLDPEDPLEEPGDAAPPMVVVPLEVEGRRGWLLRIDELPFVRQTRATRTLLGLLAQLAEANLGTARALARWRTSARPDEGGAEDLLALLAARRDAGAEPRLALVGARVSGIAPAVDLRPLLRAGARSALPDLPGPYLVSDGEVGTLLEGPAPGTLDLLARRVRGCLEEALGPAATVAVATAEAAARDDGDVPRKQLARARRELDRALHRALLAEQPVRWNPRLDEGGSP